MTLQYNCYRDKQNVLSEKNHQYLRVITLPKVIQTDACQYMTCVFSRYIYILNFKMSRYNRYDDQKLPIG